MKVAIIGASTSGLFTAHLLARSVLNAFWNQWPACVGIPGRHALEYTLVAKHRGEHGLNQCLHALGVSKGTWHCRQHQQKRDNAAHELKGKVLAVVMDHPANGYRRIKVELEVRHGTRVNHKRLWRLLNVWDVALTRRGFRPRPSGEDPGRSQGEAQPDSGM